jgi:hypothetical protein
MGVNASGATVHFSACSSGVNLKFAVAVGGERRVDAGDLEGHAIEMRRFGRAVERQRDTAEFFGGTHAPF